MGNTRCTNFVLKYIQPIYSTDIYLLEYSKIVRSFNLSQSYAVSVLLGVAQCQLYDVSAASLGSVAERLCGQHMLPLPHMHHSRYAGTSPCPPPPPRSSRKINPPPGCATSTCLLPPAVQAATVFHGAPSSPMCGNGRGGCRGPQPTC